MAICWKTIFSRFTFWCWILVIGTNGRYAITAPDFCPKLSHVASTQLQTGHYNINILQNDLPVTFMDKIPSGRQSQACACYTNETKPSLYPAFLKSSKQSHPHVGLGHTIRPVGAAMMSPIHSSRSTCSQRPPERDEFNRSTWLSASTGGDGADEDPDTVRDESISCIWTDGIRWHQSAGDDKCGGVGIKTYITINRYCTRFV